MFTGIITHFGKVKNLKNNKAKDLLLEISTEKSAVKRKLEIGCSIAINGVCLTLISKKISEKNYIFSFQASKETCKKTTLEKLEIGEIVNLEFALRVGDELGGHIVSGHVDEIGKISAIKKIKDSHQFTFKISKDLMKFVATKGSIVINGVSLTVNEVLKDSFSVNIIPHTFINTNFKNLKTGDFVNIEIDTIARYLYKLYAKK
jgi:riboflavin synthase